MPTETLKGMILTVLRPADTPDCTNGGITSKFNRVVLVDSDLPEIFEVSDKRPGLFLVRRMIGGKEYIHAEPYQWPGKDRTHYMFGGNFITTFDSCMRKIIEYPIPVHDRTEDAKLSRILGD